MNLNSTLLNDDCLEAMKNIPDNSIDLICTDPPYRYGFMGKKWDRKQDFTEIWAECLRILKPGAFAFIMNAPRSDCQLLLLTELAEVGFNIEFTPILWTYATGFLKGMNMSKAIDRKFGNEREIVGDYEHPGRKNRSYQTNSNIFSGDRKNDILHPPDISERRNTEHTRQNPYHNGKNMIKQEKTLDQLKKIHKRKKVKLQLTKPACEESQHAEGAYAGFQPKPAIEMINVVMKPLSENSYTKQFLANGKGVTFLGNCRIPYQEYKEAMQANSKGYATQTDSGVYGWNNGKGEFDPEFWKTDEGKKLKRQIVGGRLSQEKRWTFADEKVDGFKPQNFDDVNPNLKGRFPANLLISDNVLDQGKQVKSSGGKNPTGNLQQFYQGGFKHPEKGHAGVGGYGDVGDFSRYFSLDLWDEFHINRIPKEQQKTFPFLIIPKPSRSEKNKGLEGFTGKKVNDGRKAEVDNAFQRGETVRKNTHISVKPIKLMQYLILLGSQPNDVILDPFAGSGTTCVAAKIEDRKYIGIEMDPEYYEIMQARVNAVRKQKKLDFFFSKK